MIGLRFLAAAGPAARLRELGARLDAGPDAGLRLALDVDGLKLWAPPETPVLRAHDGRAALVGLLFDRAGGAVRTALPAPLPAAAGFVADHWGAYALFGAPGEAGHCVLRDPSGSIPVYFAAAGGLDIYASDAASLAAALPHALRPDLDFIRHWLTFPFLRTARTGAHGVRELLPGSCRVVERGRARIEQPWTPAAHLAHERQLLDLDDAARRLRHAILDVVPRLAPPGTPLALQLSGGLDSSILAAALANAGRPFESVTFATVSPDGDERGHARTVARRCGSPLAELVEDDAPPHFGAAPHQELRPAPNALLQPFHRALARHLAQSGAGLSFDGAGGDNVFAFLNSAAPAVDALLQGRIAASLRAIGDIAALHGTTVWTAGRAAVRKTLRSRPGPAWRRDASFLAPGAALAAPDPHPWLAFGADIPPGKADHVRSIVGIHHFLQDVGPAGAPAALHPLLAQPVLELCLGIPTWLWVRGGRDRAVAREAFRGLVPDSVLDRRGKGRLESMFMKGYMRARPALEALLLDGALAAEGIIDRAAVRSYLRRAGEPKDAFYIRLLEIAAAESWLRSFRG